MNRTLLSLAIIKSHWEKNKVDYIDNFVPMVASLAVQKKYNEIQLDTFQTDFTERFGLKIPINALITIFNRARKNGIFKREQGKYILDSNNFEKNDFTIESTDIERKFRKVISSIVVYSEKEFELKVEEEEVENALLAFLKQHDLDILFAATDKSVLPSVESSKKLKYLISSFVLFAVDSEPELFQFLLDISVGHALSGAILYSEFNSFSGKLKNLNIYIDTPLILALSGYNGDFKKSSVEELLKILNEEKANLFILETTRGEVDSILNDCHNWLEKGGYDLGKSSRILRYCHRHGINATDVEQKIVALDSILESLNIIATTVPSHVDNVEFQVDEKELKRTIQRTYKNIIHNYDLQDYSKQATIDRDVKVLSGIYRFRQGYKPKTIKDSKDIFITSNTALAFASRIFESKENGSSFTIPTCLTDIFLGTVIWLQSPQKIENLNTKKFIADCYSATQPSNELIKKYIQEVEKLKKEKSINNDEYYLLRTHRASLNLLEKKTMGDPEAFDGSSAEDILDSIMDSIKGKETEKLNIEKEEHENTKDKLSKAENATNILEEKLEIKSENIAKSISQFIFVFLVILTGFCLVVNLFSEFFKPNEYLKIFLWVFIGIVTLLNISTGFNIMGLKTKLRASIKIKVLYWLKK